MKQGKKSWNIYQCLMAKCPSSFANSFCRRFVAGDELNQVSVMIEKQETFAFGDRDVDGGGDDVLRVSLWSRLMSDVSIYLGCHAYLYEFPANLSKKKTCGYSKGWLSLNRAVYWRNLTDLTGIAT